MRSLAILTILVVAVLAVGCAERPPRFTIDGCRTIRVLEQDPDCKDGSAPWRRTMQTHCAVTDRFSGCKVGALRYANPAHSDSSSFDDWLEPRYLYARLYDWECPPGVTPPAKQAFHFVDTLVAPMACDDQGNPLPSNPLLRPKPAPSTPPVSKAESEQ